jgi:hypothetical protein
MTATRSDLLLNVSKVASTSPTGAPATGQHLSLTGGSFPASQEQGRSADCTPRPSVAIQAVGGVTVAE